MSHGVYCGDQGYNQQRMEDVARQIYQNHLDFSRRRRGIQKNKQPLSSQRLVLSRKKQEYSTGACTSSNRETALTGKDSERYEKVSFKAKIIQEEKDRKREEEIAIQRRKQSIKRTKTKIISCKKAQRRGIHRFRGAVKAVLFSIRLRRVYEDKLQIHRRWCERWSGHGLLGAIRGQRDYYEHLLSHELFEYMLLLEDSITDRPPNDRDILELVVGMATKLANSTITAEILRLLQATSTSRAFLPPDLLSVVEMERVEASPKYGCLMRVSREQTRMLVGMIIGVKIFCYYVLLQPWTLQLATVPVIQQHKQMIPMIKKVGLTFYHILMEDCCQILPPAHKKTEAILSRFGIKAILQLDPFNQGSSQNTHAHLLVNHSKSSFKSMEQQYPKIIEHIRQLLKTWICRICYATLTQPQKQASKQSSLPSKRQYRSLDLTTNQTPSPTFTEQSHRLPRIPAPRRHI